MYHRSLIGWVLVGAFCALVSCSGEDNDGAVPGFGLPCSSDKECTQYSLLCGSDDKCLQCLNDTDCKGTESCMAGLCKAPQECEDSRDCSADLVCNDRAGVCVECLTKRDCPGGQLCSNHACSDQQTCDFTSDCDDGLLCDADAGVCVSCRNDDECASGRVCTAGECVLESSNGGSGGGSEGGTTSTAGTTSGGRGGTGGKGGGGGRGGTGGTGGGGQGGSAGGPADCDCLSSEVCTADLRCVESTLIDDLADCDDEILAIEGRSGPWSGAADLDINITLGYSDPGSLWADHTCAAWATGGAKPDAVDTEFAFIGFMLNDGDAYDLSLYQGLEIKLESNNYVQVVLKTTGGGYFEHTLSPVVGSNLRSAPFYLMTMMASSEETLLDLSTVYEVQFSVTDATEFGLAVHSVALY